MARLGVEAVAGSTGAGVAVAGREGTAGVSGGAERVSHRKVWVAGGVAIAGSVVANLLVRAVAGVLFGVSPEFQPMAPGAIVAFTVAHLVVATLVFAAIARWTKRPVRNYRILAGVVLVLSLIPDVLMLAPDAAASNPMAVGATTEAVVGLMVMHVVSAAITVWALTTIPVERS